MFDTNNLLISDTNHTSKNVALANPQVFSFFKAPVKNTIPSKEITILETYQLIKSNRYQRQTEILRQIIDIKKARSYKATNFDYVTFSGTFTSRRNDGLIKHSGLITIDFDHLADVKELKTALLADKQFSTDLLFRSPGGFGLKWIVTIDLDEYTHLQYFSGIEKYIKKAYDLSIDSSGKDLARACFLPYDSEVYINPKYIQA